MHAQENLWRLYLAEAEELSGEQVRCGPVGQRLGWGDNDRGTWQTGGTFSQAHAGRVQARAREFRGCRFDFLGGLFDYFYNDTVELVLTPFVLTGSEETEYGLEAEQTGNVGLRAAVKVAF